MTISDSTPAAPTTADDATDRLREDYWQMRTAQPATAERTLTGDEWNILAIATAMHARGEMSAAVRDRLHQLAGDLGEAEWRVRRDRDSLRASLADARRQRDEARQAFVNMATDRANQILNTQQRAAK